MYKNVLILDFMNTSFWIFTGLLIVNALLYIVGLAKKIKGLEKTCRVLFVPFIAGLIHSILAGYLPDSYHLIFTSSFAFVAASLFMLFTLGDKNRFLKTVEEFFYAVSQVCWFLLIASVYRIYRIPQWLFIIAGIVYFAGFIVICIFIKKQTFAKYASALLLYAFSTNLGITALLSIIYEKRLFAVILFLGSLVYMFGTVLIIFQKTRPFAISEKVEKILITITAVAASALMGTGAILMQV